ncbi:MAG: hypothetical protein CBE00_01815 [Planctomycetaceae bacterium TMED240]|nr:hypothetical protein [Rhodopirellula sp.]OUX08375.1 MAG: hypothetical protein CBE00_01815 [Planctomycetaceae bacterium TMED240]
MLVPRTGKLGCPFESSRVLGKVQMVRYFAMGRVIDAAPLVVDLYLRHGRMHDAQHLQHICDY